MRRYGAGPLIIWALICFAAPLLLWPISRVRGEVPAWMHVGLHDHAIGLVLFADGPAGAPADSARLYAAAQGAGLWQMNPGEHTWTSASAGLASNRWRGASIVQMVYLPKTPAIALSLDVDGNLYRSFDAGESWESLTPPASSTAIDLLAVSTAGSLYLAATSALYRSDDAGQTWSDAEWLPDGMEAAYLAADLPVAGSLMVGATSGEILRTSDGGVTWQVAEGARSPIRALAGTANGTLYAATASGLLQSQNGGASWHPATPTLQGQDIQSLYFDRVNAKVLYVGLARGGVYQSQDGGEHWQRLGRDFSHRAATSLALDSVRQVLYAASDDGVWAYDLPALALKLPSPTGTPSSTPSPGRTDTMTPAPSFTQTVTAQTATATPRATATSTPRPGRTASPTQSRTPPPTRTMTFTAMSTRSPTRTATASATARASGTATASATASVTETPAPTVGPVAEPSDTAQPPATEAPTEAPPSATPPR